MIIFGEEITIKHIIYFIIFFTYIFTLFITKTHHKVYFTNKSTSNYKEHFENDKPLQIVILGDSILNNSNYTDKSLQYFINNSNKKDNVLFLAQDNATIKTVYQQLLPAKINNNSNTRIFLSVGGNNLLQQLDISINSVENVFFEYKSLINHILKTFDNCNLYLLNLYYPSNSSYKKYYPIIDKWNLLLTDNYGNNKVKNVNVIEINKYCYTNKDFIYAIEPSETCSKKIAEIINVYSSI